MLKTKKFLSTFLVTIILLSNGGSVFLSGFASNVMGYYGTSYAAKPSNVVESFSNKISQGVYHTLALKNNGTVWAFGKNTYGQLGNGKNLDSTTPVQVKKSLKSTLTDIASVSTGGGRVMYDDFSVAVSKKGEVYAWGYNEYGQLGNGKTKSTKYAIKVDFSKDMNKGIAKVSAGLGHTLALEKDGTVWAWGLNGFGQLGNGNLDNSSKPVKVIGLTDVVDVCAGSHISLAVKKDGSLWMWGATSMFTYDINGMDFNSIQSLGSQNCSLPGLVRFVSNVKTVVTDNLDIMVLTKIGKVFLFDRSNAYSPVPANTKDSKGTIAPLANIESISMGSGRYLALDKDKKIWSFGFGKKTDAETYSKKIFTKVEVPEDVKITDVSSQCLSAAAVDDRGQIWCYINNLSPMSKKSLGNIGFSLVPNFNLSK